MQGMYSYIPEINHVSRVYNKQLFCSYCMMHIMLFPVFLLVCVNVKERVTVKLWGDE